MSKVIKKSESIFALYPQVPSLQSLFLVFAVSTYDVTTSKMLASAVHQPDPSCSSESQLSSLRSLLIGTFFYSLNVPGLAEKRPSVVLEDKVKVQTRNGSDKRWFEGVVIGIQSRRVELLFKQVFQPAAYVSRLSPCFARAEAGSTVRLV